MSVGGLAALGVTILLGFLGFKDGWEVAWLLVASLGVTLVLACGVAWWFYGGLVHACGLLRHDAVAVKSRESDDLDCKENLSIFFKHCEIADQAKVVVRVLDDTDFRVFGTGVLHGRQGSLSRVLVESPAPGSAELIAKLKGSDSDTLKKLRVAVDQGYIDPRKGRFQGPDNEDETEDGA